MELLQLGSTGPIVELLQSTLNKLGLYFGIIDGIFGNQTLNAVRRFQINSSLPSDGIVGPNTWNALLPHINGNIIYTVVAGDTLASIARRFNSSVTRIIHANPDIDPNRIYPCQRLTVPFSTIVPTNISYNSNIMNLNISAFEKVYPFLQTGILGVSVLGNQIPYIKIGNGTNAVFYSASIHANEWITSVILMKFIEDFCASYINNTTIFGYSAREIFDNSSIYIAPMLNPDGVNLVTGSIKSDTAVYKSAKEISANYPAIPFPSGWKANINGIDFCNIQPQF